jgi:hypothetical protein
MSGGIQETQFVPVTTVHTNLGQEVILITTDRLTIVLDEHIEKLEDSKSWAVPAGILATIVLAFVTADFHDAFRVSKDSWAAIFILSGALTIFWLVRCLYRRQAAPKVIDIVEACKVTGQAAPQPNLQAEAAKSHTTQPRPAPAPTPAATPPASPNK